MLCSIHRLAVLTAFAFCANCLSAQQPGSPALGHGPSSGPVLPVGYHPQTTPEWCWAACDAMAISYYGTPVSDCQIVSAYFNFPCCGNPPPAFSVQTQSLQTMQQILVYFRGLQSFVVYRPLTLVEIKGEIDNGRPVIISYTGSFAGHVVTLYGYDAFDNVYIHDPWFGPGWQVPYAAAFSYNSGGGPMTWFATIYGIAPAPVAPSGGGGGGDDLSSCAATPQRCDFAVPSTFALLGILWVMSVRSRRRKLRPLPSVRVIVSSRDDR